MLTTSSRKKRHRCLCAVCAVLVAICAAACSEIPNAGEGLVDGSVSPPLDAATQGDQEAHSRPDATAVDAGVMREDVRTEKGDAALAADASAAADTAMAIDAGHASPHVQIPPGATVLFSKISNPSHA